MSLKKFPRILIAAAGSGSGKTTIVSGLLAALNKRGVKAIGYKAGPDYIDPEHHRRAGKCKIYNLDTWLTSREKVYELFCKTANGYDIAVVEGVMGLYDGGKHGISSSADIAKLLNIPVILVVNAKSVGESAAAVALGFREYDKQINLAGVILNNIGSDSHREMIEQGLNKVNIKLIGAVKRNDNLKIPERHLGLLPAEELERQNISEQEHIEAARLAVEAGVDIDKLLDAANSAPELQEPEAENIINNININKKKFRIAVARDEAFSFYYPDSLEYLESLGAELVYFSPVHDKKLPDDINAAIFGGGFPEIFARELEANLSMRESIINNKNLKILAECGGMMYLSEYLVDFDNNKYNMLGLIPASCAMHDRLQTVGYVTGESLSDNILGVKGSVLRGHEFHFSTMTPLIEDESKFNYAFKFTRLRTGKSYPGGYVSKNILASYLHLNFRGNEQAAKYFTES
ncbi:MAG: cobyrinate a,c-diamide synthase [Synergistaceae bacterium]|nr:cobyrinate a,c-diamide synthase [Synergistaceae bacterium]